MQLTTLLGRKTLTNADGGGSVGLHRHNDL